MAHTPGPWVKDYNGSLGHIKAPKQGLTPGGFEKSPTVARYDVLPDDLMSREEREANAHLISAAPDVLEACKSALRLPHDAGCHWHSGHDCTCVLNAIRAAIAKAEGK